MYVHTFVCFYLRTYINVSVYVHVNVHICMNACKCASVYIYGFCVSIEDHTHKCIIYKCICIYTCIMCMCHWDGEHDKQCKT